MRDHMQHSCFLSLKIIFFKTINILYSISHRRFILHYFIMKSLGDYRVSRRTAKITAYN